jgi:ketol-acid reductoisomerase
VPGETLLPIEKAAEKGSVIMYLLSDAGQKHSWPTVKPHLTSGKTLYFSHGFAITYKDDTGVVPPADVDVILCAPKGSGTTVRSLFLEGRGINSSVAIHQDVSGHARERAFALGVAIGSGYLYETDFKKEVFSDLTGERGTLMGAIQGMFLAQYEVSSDEERRGGWGRLREERRVEWVVGVVHRHSSPPPHPTPAFHTQIGAPRARSLPVRSL